MSPVLLSDAARPGTASGVRFVDRLARHGTRTALTAGRRSVTYAELDQLVAERRAILTEAAGGERTVVALRAERTVDGVVDYLAALSGEHAVLVGCEARTAERFGAGVLVGAGGEVVATGVRPPALHPDLRLLLSTSGSTGSPKLVRLSAGNLTSNARAVATALGLGRDDVGLTTLPLDYCYGLSVLHSHLEVGASLVLDARSVVDPDLWRHAARTGVTTVAGVPHTFALLEAADWTAPASLRLVTQAGGRMEPDSVRRWAARGRREGWALAVMYGQTEATARMAVLPPGLAEQHPDAVGRAVPGSDLRVEPVEDVPGPAGELVCRGPGVMMGYALGPADLALPPGPDELRTGDLATIDGSGLVRIVGRRSRFAKVLGLRIDLGRLEHALAEAGYDAACATSVRRRATGAEAEGGAEGGAASAAEEVVVVAVVTEAGEAHDAVRAEVHAAVRRHSGLPPHTVVVVPVRELPRTPRGKVDAGAVAALGAASLESTLPVPVTPVGGRSATRRRGRVDAVGAEYAAVLGLDAPPPASATFAGLGGDSLAFVELSVRLEPLLGALPRDWPHRTLEELAARRGRGTGGRTSRAWALLETSVALRAAAIVLIVGSHTDLFVVMGGAHLLLAVAGFGYARFHASGARPGGATTRGRWGAALRSVARIALPAIVWIGVVAIVLGDYTWSTVLLVNQVVGSPHWDLQWQYWFVEVLLHLTLAATALLTVPWLARLERRAPFAVPLGLTVVALAGRWVAESEPDRDVIHTTPYVAWLFFAGWAAARARTVGQRVAVTAVGAAPVLGFFDDPAREAVVATGLVILVWLSTVPWPRVLVPVTTAVAASSLYTYLTHWQLYPHLEDRWPLGGLLGSLVLGWMMWRVAAGPVGRVIAALGSAHDRARSGLAATRRRADRVVRGPVDDSGRIVRRAGSGPRP